MAASDVVALRAEYCGDGKCLITIQSNDGEAEGKVRYRAPIDLYCVLDVSGSMDEEVSVQTAGGKSETHGLTKLDLVKHAMRTIVHGMCDDDRLTVVQFNSVAQAVAEPLSMTAQGKARILSEIDRLTADGGTNLWGGLHEGLELLRSATIKDATSRGRTDSATATFARVPTLFLLTDGIPTIVPPRGHVPMLHRYRTEHGLPTIYTFGFGYGLDSVLLSDIAFQSDGTYAFIPDASMVGTSFINALAAVLCTVGTLAILDVPLKAIDPKSGLLELYYCDTSDKPSHTLLNVNGSVEGAQNGSSASMSQAVVENGRCCIRLGSLIKGQSRRIVLSVSDVEPGADGLYAIDQLRLRLSYVPAGHSNPSALVSQVANTVAIRSQPVFPGSVGVVQVSQRLACARALREVGRVIPLDGRRDAAELAVRNVINMVKEFDAKKATASIIIQDGDLKDSKDSLAADGDKKKQLDLSINAAATWTLSFAKGVERDLSDQVLPAIVRSEWYSRWGSHYILSLLRAHVLERCHNFKDESVQPYASRSFTILRDELDALFVALPPPKATGTRAATSVRVTSMASYHSRSNPCVDGICTVLMADGSLKRADAIRKGDSVALSAPSLEQDYPKDEQDCSKDGKVSLSNAATVICVVKTPTENKELVMLPGGLRITPYHPIRIASRFLFPCNANVAERNRNLPAESGAVYTFVLDKGHIVTINGVECATLAHGFKGSVIEHPFFGTDAVIKNLTAGDPAGYERGLVTIDVNKVRRHVETGLIVSITGDT